jgi:peroxiredoxin
MLGLSHQVWTPILHEYRFGRYSRLSGDDVAFRDVAFAGSGAGQAKAAVAVAGRRCSWTPTFQTIEFAPATKLNINKTMIKHILSILVLGTVLAQAQTNSTPLKVGDLIPDVTLRTEDDKEVSLRKLVAEKPTVLIFYRGGWCPFCNRHLQALAGIESELNRTGAQLVAISMDQPSKLKATPDREKIHYRLLSDSDANAAKAFGIAFTVEDDLVKKYMDSYKIDLEAAAGNKNHILPHPAVFVADTNGKIRFAHVNPDYKVRLGPKKILEAVQPAGR